MNAIHLANILLAPSGQQFASQADYDARQLSIIENNTALYGNGEQANPDGSKTDIDGTTVWPDVSQAETVFNRINSRPLNASCGLYFFCDFPEPGEVAKPSAWSFRRLADYFEISLYAAGELQDRIDERLKDCNYGHPDA